MDAALPLAPGPASPLRLFLRLRWMSTRNTFNQWWGQSGLRPLTYLLSSLVACSFVFTVSYSGFSFLNSARVPLTGGIVGVLFDLLFFALGGMLVFSTSLILYSSLFSAPETAFLLSGPTRDDHVFAYKFSGAIAFSSWAFLLLGGPILIAYGIVAGAPWYFYLLTPLLFFGFVLLPGAAGALFCLLLVNFLPRRGKYLVAVGGALLALGLAGWIYYLASSTREDFQRLDNRDAVQSLMGRFTLAQAPWMPSHWVSEGVRQAARRQPAEAGYQLALIWSNGLFGFLLIGWAARHLYRRGYNLVRTGGEGKKRQGGYWMDRILSRVLIGFDPQTRLLIVKDFRTFRRDPAQWAQVLIFSGLLTLYFINIRRLFIEDIAWAYQNAISFLNLCSVALLLCTYTGRFTYPLLSLEGRKFWVLGLLPLRRERLLWGKFAFAAGGCLIISTTLILISDLMLQMPVEAILLHLLTVTVLAVGLSGLSVGLGALMPNFRESDPSKIAVGFGGTMNLVVGLCFLLGAVALISGPWHAMAAVDESMLRMRFLWWIGIAVGVVAGLGMGVAAVIFPLEAGARHLKTMEF